MIVTWLIAAAALQGVADGPRKEFVDCLRKAVTAAQAANVTADNFEAYAHNQCAAIESSLKTGLAGFNVKNGMSKRSASDDAQLQIDDYVMTAAERYRYALADAQPKKP